MYTSFSPSENRRLISYVYKVNKNNIIINNEKIKQRRSVIAQINESESYKMKNKRVKVFLSYSHIDEAFKEKLDVHLAPLKRSEKIETWNDRKLMPGDSFDEEINKHLNEDEVIILLISADFINSDYCYMIELPKALERRKQGEAIVIPIILRPCLWKETPLKNIQMLPKDAKPVSKYSDEDDAYLEIAESINDIINKFINNH